MYNQILICSYMPCKSYPLSPSDTIPDGALERHRHPRGKGQKLEPGGSPAPQAALLGARGLAQAAQMGWGLLRNCRWRITPQQNSQLCCGPNYASQAPLSFPYIFLEEEKVTTTCQPCKLRPAAGRDPWVSNCDLGICSSSSAGRGRAEIQPAPSLLKWKGTKENQGGRSLTQPVHSAIS